MIDPRNIVRSLQLAGMSGARSGLHHMFGAVLHISMLVTLLIFSSPSHVRGQTTQTVSEWTQTQGGNPRAGTVDINGDSVTDADYTFSYSIGGGRLVSIVYDDGLNLTMDGSTFNGTFDFDQTNYPNGSPGRPTFYAQRKPSDGLFSKFNSYTFTWTGGIGAASVVDPLGQLLDIQVDNINKTITFLQDGKIRNNLLEWYVVFPVNSTSMTFGATGGAALEAFRFDIEGVASDFSDAPASYSTSSVAHYITDGYYIGAGATQDSAPYDSADASGDADDGVTLPTEFLAGQPYSFDVAVQGAGGFLQGWIDWDGNGSFDAGEEVATDLQDTDGNGIITISGTAPNTFSAPASSFARFRWSTISGLSADSGQAADGEVEDYQVALNVGVPVPAVVKSVQTTGDAVGDVVEFAITATNTGTAALSNVAIADSMTRKDGTAITSGVTVADPTGDDNADEFLDTTEEWVYVVSYTLTQEDVDAGGVENTATLTGEGALGPVSVTSETVEILISRSPELTVSKAVTNVGGFSKAGDEIAYAITVENTGNVTVTGVVPQDSGPTFNGVAADGALSAFSPASADLAPGESQVFTATYQLTQTDVNNVAAAADGTTAIDNAASATGTPPTGTTLPAPTPATAETGFVAAPALELVKALSSGPDPVTEAGQVLTYSFTVTNSGNADTTEAITISDPLIPDVSCPATVPLAPGASLVCEGSYTVLQSDLDNGSLTAITNTATASSGAITSPESSVAVDIEEAPELVVLKTGSIDDGGDGVIDAGDVATFTITAENTGNVQLTGVTLADSMTRKDGTAIASSGFTLSDAAGDATAGDTDGDSVMKVGEIWTYTLTYAVTQDDINAGGIDNTATATGTSPRGATATDTSDNGGGTDGVTTGPTAIVIAQQPAVEVSKTLTTAATAVGETAVFTVTAENTGNVPLSGVTIADTMTRLDGTEITSGISISTPQGDAAAGDTNADSLLNVTETWSYQISYVITQADIDAGGLENTATVTGNGPDGTPATDTSDNGTGTDGATPMVVERTPQLAITKAVTNGGEFQNAGDLINYAVTISNTGNVTITDVFPTDPGPSFNGVVGTNALSAFIPETADLAPGESQIFEAQYALSQSDINALLAAEDQTTAITNTATANGTPPEGTELPAELLTASVATGTEALISLDMVKALSEESPNPFTELGQELGYIFTITNTGNADTVEPITVNDATITDAGGAVLCPETGPLSPGQSLECTATYTITQADLDAGEVVNTATAQSGEIVSNESTVTVASEDAPALDVLKTATLENAGAGDAVGDLVTFTITVENTGNVSISEVVLSDNMVRKDGTEITADQYTLTDAAGDAAAGDVDEDSVLDADELWSYALTYLVTAEDIAAGGIENTATATGLSPRGLSATDTSDNGDGTDGATSVFLENPSLEVLKELTTEAAEVGAEVVFTVTAQNTGNVALSDVAIADTMTRLDGSLITEEISISVPAGNADAGDLNSDSILDLDEVWSFEIRYTLTQEDIDAGGIQNTATVSATTPKGAGVENSSTNGDGENGETTMPIVTNPEVTVLKTVTGESTFDAPGDVVTFEITVENTGNVTLDTITLTDTLTRADGTELTLTTGPDYVSGDLSANGDEAADAKLQVGEIWIYEASYTIVAEDFIALGIENSATATGTYGDQQVSDDSAPDLETDAAPTAVALEPIGALLVNKSFIGATRLFPTIYQYAFEITLENEGKIPHYDVSLTDDLAAFATPAQVMSVDALEISGFTGGGQNTAYDGVTEIETLAEGTDLDGEATATIRIVATLDISTGIPVQDNVVSGTSKYLDVPVTANAPVEGVDSDNDGSPDGNEGCGPNDDRDGDGTCDAEDYDPTGYFYCEEDGRVLTGGRVTVYGPTGANSTQGTTANNIIFTKDGSDGLFSFSVTAEGTYRIEIDYSGLEAGLPSQARLAESGALDVTNAADIYTGTSNPDLRVIGGTEMGSSGKLNDFSAGNNRFWTSFTIEAGDPHIFANNIPVRECVAKPPLELTKTATPSQVVIGDLVTYTVTLVNDSGYDRTGLDLIDTLPAGVAYVAGSAKLEGVANDPRVDAQRLTWRPITIRSGESLTLTYQVRVQTNAPSGNLVNSVVAFDSYTGEPASNTARATITLTPEHVFDCTDVIGKVFDDQNGNGYQDEGEPGLEGVRVVTLKGEIITTDEYGRYHVPCGALPADIGSNITLKVDARSLPSGYRITTENPRTMRATPGKMVEINFGASISQIVRVTLSDQAFAANDSRVSRQMQQGIAAMISRIQDEPSVVRISYLVGRDSNALISARLRAVEAEIRRQWRGHYRLIVETTRIYSN